MRRFSKTLLAIFLFGAATQVSGQTEYNFKVPDFIPPSPEAASLIKAGSTGVSLSTGAVSISLPLYTFSSEKFSLPLSLSYTTTGVRVNDVSSNAGMGWTLQFGGVVTRTVLGLPDEDRGPLTKNNFNTNLDERNQVLLDYLQNADLDKESDIFNFNVMGLSGNFYLDSTFTPVLLTKDNIKIKRLASEAGFEITDDKGILYSFTSQETTLKKGLSGQKCKNFYGNSDLIPVITAWYLTKIKINSNDSIVFNYQQSTTVFQEAVNQTLTKTIASDILGYPCQGTSTPQFTQCPLNDEDLTTCISELTNTVQTVNEIIFSDGSKALFSYAGRSDLPGGYKLQALKIVSTYSRLIKHFKFQQQQITSANNTGVPSGLSPAASNSYRNFLTSLRELDTKDTTKYQEYVFDYNDPSALPPRLSLAQDHWGYYNGVNNLYLLPALGGQFYNRYFDGHDGNTVKTGNREASSIFMSKGVLKRLQYPTGGYDSIVYDFPSITKYNLIRHDTTVDVSITNGDDWDQFVAVKDTIYIGTPQQVKINCDCERNVTPADFHGSCTFKILPLDTSLHTSYYKSITAGNEVNNEFVYLKAGYYVISSQATWDSTHGFMDINYENAVPTPVPYAALLGGMAVKTLRSYTSPGLLATEKIYKYATYSDTAQYSFKQLSFESDYYKYNNVKKFITCFAQSGTQNDIDCNGQAFCAFLTLNSSNQNAISVTGNNPFYFRYVTEYSQDASGNKNGYTQHKFSFADDDLGFIVSPQIKYGTQLQSVPFNFVGSFVAGEDKTETYKFSAGNYKKIALKKSYYSLQNFSQVQNHLVRKNFEYPCGGPETVEPFIVNAFDVNVYKLAYTWIRIDSTEDITYTDNLDSLQTITRFYYENPAYTYSTKTKITNSKGKNLEETKQFPADLTASVYNSAGLINKMIDKNLVSTALVSTAFNDGQQKDKLVVRYKEQPVNSKDFVVDSMMHYGPDNSVINYLAYPLYDDKLNVLTMNSRLQPEVALIWDYNKVYPIAKCMNALQADIAYTSFEKDGSGNWTISSASRDTSTAITGKKSYNLSNGSVSKSGLTSGKGYIISYWSESGDKTISGGSVTTGSGRTVDGWTYYEHSVSTSGTTITISGSGLIDELRLYSQKAQMTSYTYEPLVGVTSSCDVNNRINYYEYDDFGRLLLIKDQDKNIVKKLCYNYAGQPENCLVDANPVWQSTGVTRCQLCPANNSYITNIQEHQEKDNNSYSPTYNTYRWVSDGVNGNCVVLPDWQNTVTAIRCKTVSGNNTGEREQEQKDLNPCSPTYNQLRWVVVDQNCTVCPKAANWQSTGNYRCVKNGSNENTGYQEREERDMETCSSTYNQLRWVANGYNTTACPLPVPAIFAKVVYQDVYNDLDYTTATVVIKFFSDAACTIPTTVSNLSVNYKKVKVTCANATTTLNYSITCSGTQTIVGEDQYLSIDDGIHCYTQSFQVLSGTGYNPQ